MKYIKIVFFICAIHTLFSLKMSAQDSQVIISGVVVDNKGNQIPGAIITGNNNQTSVANDSGEFVLTVERNIPLTINALGYKTTSVEAKSDLQTIVLESSEMVQVAFNAEKVLVPVFTIFDCPRPFSPGIKLNAVVVKYVKMPFP